MINQNLQEIFPSKNCIASMIRDHTEDSNDSSINLDYLAEVLLEVIKKTSEESWVNGYTSALIDNKWNSK